MKVRNIYQGWIVLVGAFVAHMIATNLHFSFGLMVVPVSKELQISRADTNNWLIAVGIGSALLAPIAGRLMDRYSIRLLMAAGGILIGVSFVAIALASTPWVMVLMALPVALGTDCAGGLGVNTLMARWFRRHRGRAISLVGVATFVGGFALTPLLAHMVVSYGWRTALAGFGLAGGSAIVLVVILFVSSRPTEEQLGSSGELDRDATEEEHRIEQRVWTYRELLRDRNFLLLMFGGGLLLASDRAVLVSIAPYLSDDGISLQRAAFMLSALSGSSIVGNLIVGSAADRFDPRKIFLAVAIMHVLLLGTLLLHPAYWVLILLSLILGMGLGGVLPTMQVLAASVFGSASYGTVIGSSALILQVLMMIALRFIGEVRDHTGSYELAFQVFSALVVIAAILVWQLRIPRRKFDGPD